MPNPEKTKLRVLIVDDEPSLCQTLRIVLTREGYEVRTAWSGEEALNLLAGQPAELVITDFTMSRMRGDALAKIIRDRWPQTGVIMLTASADLLRSSAMELPGVDCLMSKPFALEEFRNSVRAILRKNEADKNSIALTESLA